MSSKPNNLSGKAGSGPGAAATVNSLHKRLVEAEKKRKQGRLKEAETMCRALLDTDPTYVGALQTFGLVAIEQKNYRQAVTCFLTAAATAPTDPTNFTNLAAAWLGLEIPDMAAVMLREARRLDDKNPAIHHLLGDVFSHNKQFAEAMKSYRDALAIDPDFDQSLLQLCQCYLNLGYFDKAAELLVRLRKLRPDVVSVAYMLLQLPGHMIDDTLDLHAVLRKARKQQGEMQADFDSKKAFVEAAILDRQAKHGEAWQVLCDINGKLNREAQALWATQSEAHNESLSAAIALDGSKLPRPRDRKPADGPAPLFILGPSRAGKTTLEKLVGAHGDVNRGYEGEVVQFASRRAAQKAGFVNIASLAQLPKNLLGSFAAEFRQRLSDTNPDHKLVSITTPGLISSAGLLAQNLPEARFVFIRRDRDDTAFRIFMKSYSSGNHYNHDLKNAYAYIDWYAEMIDVLSGKLRQRAVVIDYADMIADP
ncbi:MAG: tetratricopeptide repeat protein, partial [Pseudomonadota bacterium]